MVVQGNRTLNRVQKSKHIKNGRNTIDIEKNREVKMVVFEEQDTTWTKGMKK